MCPISDTRPWAITGLAVVALRLAKPIRFVMDSHHLFPSLTVPSFHFLLKLSHHWLNNPLCDYNMLQLITAPNSRILLIILITFLSISSGSSFNRPLGFWGRAMKSTSGLSVCCRFNDFTNPQIVDYSETPYFFAVGHAPWENACFATSHLTVLFIRCSKIWQK